MTRKENYIEAAIEKSFYNEKLVPFLEGAKWADENPKDGARDILVRVDEFFRKLNSCAYLKDNSFYELQNTVYEYIKCLHF